MSYVSSTVILTLLFGYSSTETIAQSSTPKPDEVLPDYFNSPFFSTELHYTLDVCSKMHTNDTDFSAMLFLDNTLFVPTFSEDACVFGCVLHQFTSFKDGYNIISLIDVTEQLRNNIRKDFPRREASIGHMFSLMALCFPLVGNTKDVSICDVGKEYQKCVMRYMAKLPWPTDYENFKGDPFKVF